MKSLKLITPKLLISILIIFFLWFFCSANISLISGKIKPKTYPDHYQTQNIVSVLLNKIKSPLIYLGRSLGLRSTWNMFGVVDRAKYAVVDEKQMQNATFSQFPIWKDDIFDYRQAKVSQNIYRNKNAAKSYANFHCKQNQSLSFVRLNFYLEQIPGPGSMMKSPNLIHIWKDYPC